MRVVIVGGSKFGAATAEALIDNNHEVVIVDRDRARLDHLAARFDCGLIEGDGTSPTVLRDAVSGPEDVLIALTNASDDNILAALVGRSVGFGRVIPQIILPELLEVCAELDLTDTITPHVTVARSPCNALEEETEMNEDLNLSRELRLKRVEVGARAAGQPLGDIAVPEGARAVAVITEDRETLAEPDHRLAEGDTVLFAMRKECVDDLKGCFA